MRPFTVMHRCAPLIATAALATALLALAGELAEARHRPAPHDRAKCGAAACEAQSRIAAAAPAK